MRISFQRFSHLVCLSQTQRAKVRGVTIVINSLIAFPTGLPNFSKLRRIGRCDRDPARRLGSEDLILFLEVSDLTGQLFFRAAGQHDEQRVDNR